jgi:putative transposase
VKTNRKRHSAQYKFEVALDAARGSKTINELASEYGLHPTQISHWKQQLMVEGSSIFTKGLSRSHRRQEEERAELFEQIDRLKMELEWVKKKLPLQLR